jgi:hypothetical protein
MSEQSTPQTSWFASLSLPWRRNGAASADVAGNVASAPQGAAMATPIFGQN